MFALKLQDHGVIDTVRLGTATAVASCALMIQICALVLVVGAYSCSVYLRFDCSPPCTVLGGGHCCAMKLRQTTCSSPSRNT